MSFTTLETTIDCLGKIFWTHGIPEVFLSYNGTQSISAGFSTFMKHSGICHLNSAPCHPATRGMAEQAVQTFKNNMNKDTQGTLQHELLAFYSHIGSSHMQKLVLFYRVPVRKNSTSHLDLLKPAKKKQQLQKRQQTGRQTERQRSRQAVRQAERKRKKDGACLP